LLVDEHSSSEEMPYKFNGKEFDEETGLYYYGARYMNPVASVWYGVDPLAKKYPNMGAYVYCAANPIKLIDPDFDQFKSFIHSLSGMKGDREKDLVNLVKAGKLILNLEAAKRPVLNKEETLEY
jgi:RHS repeat-associated protein